MGAGDDVGEREADGAAAAARARDAVADAVRRLSEASARTEVLAEYVPPRRVIGVARAARLTPVARVWRLGVLLLDADGRLYAAGRVVRAERQVRRSVIAESVAEHRALRVAAIKGGIAEGETVAFDAVPLRLGAEALAAAEPSATLTLADDADGALQVMVRWNPTRDNVHVPLAAYLAERADLLAHPPLAE